MPIPDYQSVFLPLLRLAKDQQEHSLRQSVETLADQFNLSADERRELLPSGQQTVFGNRVAWAGTYLRKADLLQSTRRGHFRITERGLMVLAQNPTIDIQFLNQFPEFRAFRALRHKKSVDQAGSTEEQQETPEEALEQSHQRLRDNLASELLEQILAGSPSMFERLVVQLLVKMGYGGTLRDAGQAIGRTGDEGIDGIIKEDRLGLDVIYLQAKRWKATVSRPEIQKFAGALQGQRARKGVFITTSNFSKDAHEYASRIDTKIILIDGELLAQLMIDHNVGVTTVSIFELKRIDSDYFAEG